MELLQLVLKRGLVLGIGGVYLLFEVVDLVEGLEQEYYY
jgi:hypothetical protein